MRPVERGAHAFAAGDRAQIGLVPPGLEDRVAYLNLADRERPVGLNLLDVTLFPDRDRTAENVVTIMHRLWPDNWGPRMEGALRASIMALHEANQARRREKQYTLLDVVPMLSNEQFRQEVLKQVPDRTLWAWWRDNFNDIGRVLQQQTANPVTTKVGRFLVTQASRLVLGRGYPSRSRASRVPGYQGSSPVSSRSVPVGPPGPMVASSATTLALCSAGRPPPSAAVKSVAVKPGSTALNVMPGSALAYWTVSIVAAALEAA